ALAKSYPRTCAKRKTRPWPGNTANLGSARKDRERRDHAASPAKRRAGKKKAPVRRGPRLPGGDAGIRTLDTGFGPYAPLAGECLRPLGHVSKRAQLYRRAHVCVKPRAPCSRDSADA